MSKPRIIQHSFGVPGSGGPIGALTRVLSSDLSEQFDFRHVSQPTAAGGLNLRLIETMAREMRQFRPDLAHIRGLGNEGFHGVLAARSARVPRILVSVHGSVNDLVHDGGGIRGKIVGSVLEPLTLRLATHVTTVCESALDKPILRPVRRKIVGVVPNGVDMSDAPLHDRSGVRFSLRIPEHDLVLIIVARLTRDKGHIDLLDALESLPVESTVPLHLLVVGDGPDRDLIHRRASTINGVRIHLLGRRQDVTELLGAADIAVLPSWHENMSNALLEAMAAGLPVITTAVGGNTEIVSRGGGMLVVPGDRRALASAIGELLVDPPLRASLGIDARSVIESGYTTGHMTRRLASIYTTILKG